MNTMIKIENVINDKEKVSKLRHDILRVALYMLEKGSPDWYIEQYANSKLDFLNNFIELKKPFNEDNSTEKLVYTGKTSLKFHIDIFDILVTDHYKDRSHVN